MKVEEYTLTTMKDHVERVDPDSFDGCACLESFHKQGIKLNPASIL